MRVYLLSCLVNFILFRLIHFGINERSLFDRFLIVDLVAFNGSGLGNMIFELIGTLALARKLNRTLVVHQNVHDKIIKEHPEFVNLIGSTRSNLGSSIAGGKIFDYESFHCCRFNPKWKWINSPSPLIYLRVKYLQSFKYFESLTLKEIRRLLRLNLAHQTIAREGLLNTSMLNEFDHKLCVHSRRGDFLTSYEQAPSTEAFTVPAITYLLKHLNSVENHTLVIMIGDDLRWQTEIVKRIENTNYVILPRSPLTRSVSVYWQFSQIYCDSVLLTASASSFGWWLAYLSKGQQVYYNSIYAKEDRFENHLDPHDFFPHSWTSLELKKSQIIKRHRFTES